MMAPAVTMMELQKGVIRDQFRALNQRGKGFIFVKFWRGPLFHFTVILYYSPVLTPHDLPDSSVPKGPRQFNTALKLRGLSSFFLNMDTVNKILSCYNSVPKIWFEVSVSSFSLLL